MDEEAKLEKSARASAFVAALACAVGKEAMAEEYLDRMMRAWALLAPVEGTTLFGVAGGW